MAAGKGERMRPLTLATPKPLLPIAGLSLIETAIIQLKEKGIDDITIVTGYLSDAFLPLARTYELNTIHNPDYDTANNIASLYYAREKLLDTIILDGDQFISGPEAIKNEISQSGYCCRWNNSESKEWLLSVDEDMDITGCSREGGYRGWELLSCSYWLASDSQRLKALLEEEYGRRRNRDIYWDDLPIFIHSDSFRLKAYPVGHDSIIEVDTVEEYEQLSNQHKGVNL